MRKTAHFFAGSVRMTTDDARAKILTQTAQDAKRDKGT